LRNGLLSSRQRKVEPLMLDLNLNATVAPANFFPFEPLKIFVCGLRGFAGAGPKPQPLGTGHPWLPVAVAGVAGTVAVASSEVPPSAV